MKTFKENDEVLVRNATKCVWVRAIYKTYVESLKVHRVELLLEDDYKFTVDIPLDNNIVPDNNINAYLYGTTREPYHFNHRDLVIVRNNYDQYWQIAVFKCMKKNEYNDLCFCVYNVNSVYTKLETTMFRYCLPYEPYKDYVYTDKSINE